MPGGLGINLFKIAWWLLPQRGGGGRGPEATVRRDKRETLVWMGRKWSAELDGGSLFRPDSVSKVSTWSRSVNGGFGWLNWGQNLERGGAHCNLGQQHSPDCHTRDWLTLSPWYDQFGLLALCVVLCLVPNLVQNNIHY